ncbi:cytochrome P450 2J2-like [Synchiropus splendidus]|uniref:cytochrome P450 2J2-like n=1 Tax=Synchiropus splendidus TaxID=270530 RepID=UPI00237D50B7|nr:cytochrome P450 2J2-like [Synchiropus splendidus]
MESLLAQLGLDCSSLLLFLCIFLLVFDVVKYGNPKNFPPGPWPLPFIGDMHRLDPHNIHLQLAALSQKYGRIFSLRLFGVRVVVLNGYKVFREAIVVNAEDYMDRPNLPLLEEALRHRGLLMTNSYLWKKQRRFALHNLRNFGLGKRKLEPIIQEEANYLAETFDQHQGKPFDVHCHLHRAVANIIFRLLFAERFEYDDEKYHHILDLYNKIQDVQESAWVPIYNTIPWLLKWFPGPHQMFMTAMKSIIEFKAQKIKEHGQTLDPTSPRDYTDSFLIEMMQNIDRDAGFDVENLAFNTMDLALAGSVTTATTLRWALKYITHDPHVQERVHAEIDAVIGTSRQPSIADRDNMPYTNAVIHECQRMGNVVPLNVMHMTAKETKLDKYTIPKGTLIIPSLDSVLHDDTVWETPHSFNPGHFLDKDGNFRRRDAFVPFSAGKRVCVGEQLARMELFLFITTLMQRFSLSLPPGEQPSLEYTFGLVRRPKDSLLCAVPR